MTNFSFNRAKIVSISDTFTFQFSLLISRFSPNSRNTTEMNKTHQLNDASSLTRFIFSVKMLKIAFTINVPFVEDLQISTELTWDQFMLSCLSRFVFFFFLYWFHFVFDSNTFTMYFLCCVCIAHLRIRRINFEFDVGLVWSVSCNLPMQMIWFPCSAGLSCFCPFLSQDTGNISRFFLCRHHQFQWSLSLR